MAKTVSIDSNLYGKPPKSAIPGQRWDYREHSYVASTEMIAGTSAVILALGVLPAGHRCLSIYVESERLDGNSANRALTYSVGLLNSYYGDPLAGNYCSRLNNNGQPMGNNGWDNGAAPALVSGNVVMTDVSGNNRIRAGVDTTMAIAQTWGVDSKNDRIIAIEITNNAAGGNANNGAKIALMYAIDID